MTAYDTALPIAVQLHTLRMLPGGIGDMLSQVRATGFHAVEMVAHYGLDAVELRALVDTHALRVISAHVQFDALYDTTHEVIAFNRILGNDTLVIPFIPALRHSQTVDVYREMGRQLGQLARACRAEGMHLLYHNHHFEFVARDGQSAFDWLVDSAGPELGLEPDLAWIAAAGVDPVTVLQRYAGRCLRVLIKDLAPTGERVDDAVVDGIVMSDVGQGKLDWARLLPAAENAGAQWFIVEHDNPQDPVASISQGLNYLRQHLPDMLGKRPS